MKYLPSTLFLGALVLTLHAQTPEPKPADDPFIKTAAADAKAKEDDSSLNCYMVVEAYALDKNAAAALLEAEQGNAARYRRVLDLVKTGQARLEILTALTTKSGQRAVVQANDEVRYATEFPPPVSAKGAVTPTAWETRNVGDTFEVEPVINKDGRTCEVNLIPQHCTLVGFRDWPEKAEGLAVAQPIFNTQRITTSTTTTDGEPHYLGTMTPPTPQGMANGAGASEVWLTFLHISLLKIPAAATKAPARLHPEAPINLEYSCYSLDRAAAREILVAPASITAPWEKLQALLGEKKARLEHLSTIKTKPGQRAVAEEIQEFRYMAECQPESRLGSAESTRRTVTTSGHEPKAGGKPEAASTVTETITTTHTDANSERLPAFATAFETRNTGVTVEVEPVVGPNGLVVDLNEAVQSVRHLGNLQVTGAALHYPAQPLFESSKVTTSQTLPVAQYVLVSTLNPPGADGVNDRADTGRTWVLFVRAIAGDE